MNTEENYSLATWKAASVDPISTKFNNHFSPTDLIIRSNFGRGWYGSFGSAEEKSVPSYRGTRDAWSSPCPLDWYSSNGTGAVCTALMQLYVLWWSFQNRLLFVYTSLIASWNLSESSAVEHLDNLVHVSYSLTCNYYLRLLKKKIIKHSFTYRSWNTGFQ